MCPGDFQSKSVRRGRRRLAREAEMDAPVPHMSRPSSWCLGHPGPRLAQPGPVRRLSAGKLGSAGLRPARETDGRKVAGGDWVCSGGEGGLGVITRPDEITRISLVFVHARCRAPGMKFLNRSSHVIPSVRTSLHSPHCSRQTPAPDLIWPPQPYRSSPYLHPPLLPLDSLLLPASLLLAPSNCTSLCFWTVPDTLSP